MNIGTVASRSGLPAKTIRYYEDIGLITPERLDNGYRSYNRQDTEKLRFLQRCRSLGFSIGDCRKLLWLYEDNNRASTDVKLIATRHLRKIKDKARKLESLKNTLTELINRSQDDSRPDCPIINDLSGKRS